MEGFAGRLVGNSPTVRTIRDESKNLDRELVDRIFYALEQVAAKRSSKLPAEKQSIIFSELYRSGELDLRLLANLIALSE